MRLAFAEAERLDVHWTYTNIYLMDAANSVLGGQLLNIDAVRLRGEQRLVDWAKRTKQEGAPHEFNSPTYSAVQINALAAIAQFAEDDATRRLAGEMEQFVWRHVAPYWHAPTMQLGGPHSRAYRRDVAGAPGFLKVLLYKLLGDTRLLAPSPYYSGPDTEGEVQVALTEYHCPPEAERLFRESECRQVREMVGRNTVLTAHTTPEFSLGTMSRPYTVGEPPESWPQHNSCILYYSKRELAGLRSAVLPVPNQRWRCGNALPRLGCPGGSISGTTASFAPRKPAAAQSSLMGSRRRANARSRACGST